MFIRLNLYPVPKDESTLHNNDDATYHQSHDVADGYDKKPSYGVMCDRVQSATKHRITFYNQMRNKTRPFVHK